MRPSGYGPCHCDIRYGSKIGQAHPAVLPQCLVDLSECDASLNCDGPSLWVQGYDPIHFRTQIHHVDAFLAILLCGRRLVNTDLVRGVTLTDDFNEVSTPRA